MSKFTQTEHPLGRYLAGGKLFRLAEAMPYDVGAEGSAVRIIVPAGFVTDFASIPRVAQVIIPKDVGRRAAILHDWLYATNGCRGFFTRAQADAIFLEALGVLNVFPPARWAMYSAVRLGGWWAWAAAKNKPLRIDD